MYAVKYENTVMGTKENYEVFTGDDALERASEFAQRHAKKYNVETSIYRLDYVYGYRG